MEILIIIRGSHIHLGLTQASGTSVKHTAEAPSMMFTGDKLISAAGRSDMIQHLAQHLILSSNCPSGCLKHQHACCLTSTLISHDVLKHHWMSRSDSEAAISVSHAPSWRGIRHQIARLADTS